MPELIGFYSLLPTPDNKGYLGALLVTDTSGTPAEFRVTYPVKPNAIQSTIYGASLVPYVGVELCGKPLIASLKSSLAILLLCQRYLLPLAKDAAWPVVCVSRPGESLQVDEGVAYVVNDRLDTLNAHWYAESPSDRRAQAHAILDRFAKGMDLLEPFERIKTASGILAQQNEKFR